MNNPFRNLFHIHTWGQWTVRLQTDVLSTKNNAVIGYVFLQSRACKTCGLTEYNKQKVEP